MENQSFTYVNPSAAESTLTDNYSQLLAYLRHQHSMTSPDSGSHTEIRAGIPTMDDCHVATSPLNQIQLQQINSTIARLSQEQNSSLGTHTEIPMDLQQATSRPMPTQISMSQLMAQRNSVPLIGSGFNLDLGLMEEIPMDQLHVQQTTTAPILTLIPVSQLMAQQSASGPNSGLGLRDEISMDQVHFQETTTATMMAQQSGSGYNSGPWAGNIFMEELGREQIGPVGQQNMDQIPHFNEAEQPHRGYEQNCPERLDMDRLMMECQDYVDQNRGSLNLVYPEAPGPFHQIFMMEDTEHRLFLEELKREEQQIQHEATRQKAYCVSIVEYLYSVPNLSHEDRDRFMTMCPPISLVELDLFMRLRVEINEVYTKIQQLEEESTQKIADLEAIGNYVMFFINDHADFMANQTDAMQVPVDAEVGDSESEADDTASEVANAGSEASDARSDVSDFGSDIGDTGSEVGDAGLDVSDAGSDVSDNGSELGDAGSDISDDGSEDDGIRILQSFTIVGATEPMDIAEIIDYEEMQPRCPCSPLYIEIPPLEDPEVILANAAEDWAEDAEDPQDERIYWEEN